MSTTEIAPPAHLSSDGEAQAETRLPRRLVLGFLLLISFGTGVVLSILGPTVPAMAAHLGVSVTALGVLFTATFLMATLATATSGALVNRIGNHTLIPIGCIAMALGLLGEGTTGTVPLVALGAVFAGAGTGIINVCVNAATARLYPARRDHVLTWLNICFGIGAFLTPLAAGFSLTRLGSYTPIYIVGAAFLVVPILPVMRGLPVSLAEAVGSRSPAKRAAVLALLRDRDMLLLTAIATVYLGAEIGFGGWVVSMVAAMTHLAPAYLAPAASAFWICLAAGGVPTILLLHRGIPARRLIVLGALSAAMESVLLVVVGGSAPLAMVCCALIGLSFAPILPLATALAASGGDADRSDGIRIAALFTCGQVGAAALPAIQGMLLAAGPRSALLLTFAAALAMAALAVAVRPKHHAASRRRLVK